MCFQKLNEFLSHKSSEASSAALLPLCIQELRLPPVYCSVIPQDIVLNCLIEAGSVAHLGSSQQKGQQCVRAHTQCLKSQTLLPVSHHWLDSVTWPCLIAKESGKLGLPGHYVPEKEHSKHLMQSLEPWNRYSINDRETKNWIVFATLG